MTLAIEQLSSPLLPTVSFQAEAGSCICIYGESGTGKTLLLRAIADLDPNSGNITLDGEARDNYPADQWRRLVSYLPAESHWWSNDVRDHFNSDSTEFASLGLPEEIGSWQVSHLSSGEKQRLALLRALDHNPQVLLLDEVTANLDEENTQRVERLLNDKLKAGLTLIWVSHDRQQRARMATQSYLIQDKKFLREPDHGTG